MKTGASWRSTSVRGRSDDAMTKSDPTDLIRSLQRGLSVLESVATLEDGKAAPKTIASSLGLNLSTVYHLANTLVHCGYLVRENGHFQLGVKLAQLYSGLDVRLRPNEYAVAAMHRLRDATKESAYLSSWYDGNVYTIASLEGTRPVRVVSLPVGLGGSAHARASGKLLLACGPPARLDEYLARGPLERTTRATVTDPELLRLELQRIRLQGFAEDHGEFADGVCCLSALLPGGNGSDAVALTVSMPTDRFADTRESSLTVLLDVVRWAVAKQSDPTPASAR